MLWPKLTNFEFILILLNINHLLLLVIIMYNSMLYELNILSYHHRHIDVYTSSPQSVRLCVHAYESHRNYYV